VQGAEHRDRDDPGGGSRPAGLVCGLPGVLERTVRSEPDLSHHHRAAAGLRSGKRAARDPDRRHQRSEVRSKNPWCGLSTGSDVSCVQSEPDPGAALHPGFAECPVRIRNRARFSCVPDLLPPCSVRPSTLALGRFCNSGRVSKELPGGQPLDPRRGRAASLQGRDRTSPNEPPSSVGSVATRNCSIRPRSSLCGVGNATTGLWR